MPRLSKIGAAALGAFGWTSGAAAVTASYLVVAGGAGAGGQETTAGGGGWSGGGGGAGGLLTSTISLNLTLSYTVTVGAGGTGGTSSASPTNGSNGSNSIFSSITATGGGGGGAGGGNVSGNAGLSGGSGGGGGSGFTGAGAAGGAGTVGQGNAGGTCPANSTGGGGGGAGGAGGVPTRGIGSAYSISGSSVTYAVGGLGQYNASNTPGTANRGNGGDNSTTINTNSLNGGSGVVIISYAGAQQFGGGVVTSSGGNTIHTFNTSGTLAPLSSLTVNNLLLVAGGGGGYSGGGGAGGFANLTSSSITIDTNSNYIVTVGAGGSGGNYGSSIPAVNGGNSTFSIYATAAVGGGAGTSAGNNGNTGGSGSGGAGSGSGTTTGGAGTLGQGNAGGGNAGFIASPYPSGGGGGAFAIGSNAPNSTTSGAGGAGANSSISGTSTTYAGGGGGGTFSPGNPAGAGGSGGGGAGSSSGNGTDGTANLGGGGGGSSLSYIGGAGGSGIVIISYAGATQQMAGGTVTISGGNVIHTFTSSGYLTPLKLVNNSLRFRYSNSAYLSRTPSVSSNRTTWTYSYWFKGMNATASVDYWSLCAFSDGSNYTSIRHHNSSYIDVLSFNGGSAVSIVKTANLFRDPAAWNHMVIVFDTSNATQADRIQIYQNGVRCAIQGGATYPGSGSPTGWINAASTINYIGRQSTEYFDGYMTEINFIDGQALTPNSFGTFNSYGVWQPITYGGSYGTNGFYLPFTNKTSTTTLGYDFSPNGNNWTPNNLSLTAGATYDSMTDVPTLTSANTANYAVLNPLSALNSTASDGNLKGTLNAASVTTDIYGTMASGTTGKFYWETTYVSRSGNSALTIGGVRSDVFGAEPSGTGGFGYYSVGGQVFVNGSTVDTYATYATSDVIGIALDLTNSQVSFYKQTSGTGSFVLQGTVSIASGYSWIPGYANGTTSGNQVVTVNFGQQPFNNSSPPSGFLALNTYNI
jgi:hypothetical protein